MLMNMIIYVSTIIIISVSYNMSVSCVHSLLCILSATSSTISKGAVNKQQLAVTSTSGEECRGSPSLSSAKSLSLDDALDDDDRSGSSITIKDNGTGASNDSGQTNDELSASVPQQPSTETEVNTT